MADSAGNIKGMLQNIKGMLQHLFWYQSIMSALTMSVFHTKTEYRNVKIRIMCLV